MKTRTGPDSLPTVTSSNKKQKKKKKMMNSSIKENLDPKTDSYKDNNKDKMVPVLATYLNLQNLKLKTDLYDEFEKYVLTPEQLARNNYPLENPEKPGHIIARLKTYHPSPTQRYCSRCGKIYFIENDRYRSDTNCIYHSKHIGEDNCYRCCGKPSTDIGCKLGYSHINTSLPLDELVFKKTEHKKQVKAEQLRRVFGLDCEMVYTTFGFEVAKVTLVDIKGKPVYNSLVLPQHPVTDFNSQFSGIRKSDLLDVKVTLDDVQAFLLKTINKDTILVGHALQNDLQCLRIIHEKVVDTQVVFRQPNDTRRKKLMCLARDYLNQSIQDSPAGHCSLQDSRACMELMLKKIQDSLACPVIDTTPMVSSAQSNNPPRVPPVTNYLPVSGFTSYPVITSQHVINYGIPYNPYYYCNR